MKHTTALLAVLLLAPFAGFSAAATSKPNIILIYSDDHGFADLGVQGVDKDIRTPNLDALANDGVRFIRGYVSAPQCVPSRAGLMTGRYQQRFGVEDNTKGPLPLSERTIAELLKPAGYVSCQVGKWHLEPTRKPGAKAENANNGNSVRAFLPLGQGFDEYFTGPMNRFVASHDLQGHKLDNAPQPLTDKRFRCVWQADAAISFVERHAGEPFFLYLAFFTPHVPLESPEPWFSKTPATLPKERRQALAMIAAMDDGIGRLRAKLRELGIEKNTLIFFISDNGAPLKEGAWDGSLNLPLVGEKGMLTDGGIRVPFVAAWPGTLPAGKTFEPPVINLDVAATALAIAGLPRDEKLDGVNLLPFLLGEKRGDPHDALYWRWRSQAAIRADHWKYIRVGPEERYLFDLDAPEGESELAKNNLISRFPEVAADLEKRLMAWNATLPPPGLPREPNAQDNMFYDAHVKRNGVKSVKNVNPKKKTEASPAATTAAAATKTKPNIVFILADDLGYGDVHCLNPQRCKIATPHLDKLASQGMIFTDAHSSSSVCSPTRYGVLTGRYNWRSRLQKGVLNGFSEPLIDADRLTVPQLLKQHGYTTACIGKWHLGMGIAKGEPSPVITDGPTTRGFDRYYGISASLDMPPFAFIENDHFTEPLTTIKKWQRSGPAAASFEAVDVLPTLARKAVEFITAQAKTGEPFFLYMPLNAPHTPIVPTKEWQGKSGLGKYGDFVMETDWAVGEVLAALDAAGVSENTLVFFTSDNGCSPAAGFAELQQQGHYPSADMRGHKADIFDGGHRIPFLARWPGRVQAGSRCDQTICLTDLMATCADILGTKLPDNAGEDSVSILPALLGTDTAPLHEAVVHHSINGSFAIRQGKWKLELCADSGGWSAPRPGSQEAKGLPDTQLYDLSTDIAESKNLQAEHPEVVARLTKLLERIIADGRSTPGAKQANDVPIELRKGPRNARKRKSAGNQ